jgi:hypothetical protein
MRSRGDALRHRKLTYIWSAVSCTVHFQCHINYSRFCSLIFSVRTRPDCRHWNSLQRTGNSFNMLLTHPFLLVHIQSCTRPRFKGVYFWKTWKENTHCECPRYTQRYWKSQPNYSFGLQIFSAVPVKEASLSQ